MSLELFLMAVILGSWMQIPQRSAYNKTRVLLWLCFLRSSHHWHRFSLHCCCRPLLLSPLAGSTLMHGLIQLNCSYVFTGGERRKNKAWKAECTAHKFSYAVDLGKSTAMCYKGLPAVSVSRVRSCFEWNDLLVPHSSLKSKILSARSLVPTKVEMYPLVIVGRRGGTACFLCKPERLGCSYSHKGVCRTTGMV